MGWFKVSLMVAQRKIDSDGELNNVGTLLLSKTLKVVPGSAQLKQQLQSNPGYD